MIKMSVRDLRQRWPRAEEILRTEREIIITRDGKPVAKLVRVREPRSPRKRFDASRHAAWQARMSRGRKVHWVDEFLTRDRDAG
jgi:antitoxin (DNA-binding transcriptional repressor) of toxin-antitoxin stability system